MRWVEPKAINPEYWSWRATECETVYDHFAPQNARVIGEKVPGQLASRLTCLISHSQRERCCEWHPEGFLGSLADPIRIERDLDMTKDQASFYRSMERSYFAYLTSPGPDGKVPVVAELPIVARGMLRFCALALPSFNEEENRLYFMPETESPKLDQLITDMAALDGKRVLILTHSKQYADLVQQRVTEAGFAIDLWRGGLSSKRRDAILNRFISGETDAIVGVISAMGTGTDGVPHRGGR